MAPDPITVLPRSSSENRIEPNSHLITRPFAPPAPQRRVALVWRKSFPRLKAIARLRDGIIASGMKGVSYLKDAIPQEE